MRKLLCILGFHNWNPIAPCRLLSKQNLETCEFQVLGVIERSQCTHCQAILHVAPKEIVTRNRWIQYPSSNS
jgi:hypothetical protein